MCEKYRTLSFDHMWSEFYVIFSDSEGSPIEPKIRIDYMHKYDFVFRRIEQEYQVFSVRVPMKSQYISVQYGLRKDRTKRIRIPMIPLSP
jgi:hypothetical protein